MDWCGDAGVGPEMAQASGTGNTCGSWGQHGRSRRLCREAHQQGPRQADQPPLPRPAAPRQEPGHQPDAPTQPPLSYAPPACSKSRRHRAHTPGFVPASWSLPALLLTQLIVCSCTHAAASLPGHDRHARRMLAGDAGQGASGGGPQDQWLQQGPSLLAQCIERGADQARRPPLTWDLAMRDELGSLHVHGVWWSEKRTQLPVTVVTQLSATRLSQLSAQCRGWPGPLSAAVYLPLLEVNARNQLHVRGAAAPGVDLDGSASDPSVTSAGKVTHTLRRNLVRAAAYVAWEASQAAPGVAAAVAAMLNHTRVTREAETGATRVSSEKTHASPHHWLQEPLNTATTRSRGNVAAGGTFSLSRANQELVQLAEQAVAAFHMTMEHMSGACALDLVLVYEVLADARAATLLYPVNQLRNLARLQARTELVAQLDVDMLISADLATWIAEPRNAQSMLEAGRNKAVYVLPAFEAHGDNVSHSAALADSLALQSKQKLREAQQQRLVTHFDATRFPQGHNATNFRRWFAATDAYEITYTYRYEPWLIVNRKTAPWHDVRFRGYGNNKIQQVSHLNATGHHFYVHPIGFIIHRAHSLTEARKQLITDLRSHSLDARKPGGKVNRNTLYGHTKVLFELAKDAMDRGVFTPVTDAGTRECAAALPWYTQQGA